MRHELKDRPLLLRLQKRIEKYQLAHRSSPLAVDVELHRQSMVEIEKLTEELNQALLQLKANKTE